MPSVINVASRHRVLLIALAVVATVSALALRSREGPSLVQYVWAVCTADIRSPSPQEGPYLLDNVDAMTKMMAGMEIRPTGDVDRDFVAMMVPHHQGAIDMAVAVLRYGHNQKIRRLAQEIIVTQQQEIVAMRLAVGEALPPAIPSPTQVSPAHPSLP